jgi:hypothetical protein
MKHIIPDQLEQETHLLEYYAGTYGDYVCGIISYSIDGYYDDYVYLEDEGRYWKVEHSLVKRNRYSLSLRGNGYEHVENYTDFMLAHKIWTDFQPHYDTMKPKKVLFNTHPRIGFADDNPIIYRTITNKFKNVKTKIISMPLEFNTIFKVACNEYYTSRIHKLDTPEDLKAFYGIFKLHVDKQKGILKCIPEKQRFIISDIDKLSPKDIVSYGDVDREKFESYQKLYNDKKMDVLNWHTKRLYEKIKESRPGYILDLENYLK